MTFITPPPERGQHDKVVVRPAGRKNRATVHVQPPYDLWHDREMIDRQQREAAKIYCEDVEATSGKVRSSLASLDRIDLSSMGVVQAELESEAGARLTSVRQALGPVLAATIHRVLVDRMDMATATGKSERVAVGVIVAALEVMAVSYGFRTEKA